MMASESMHSSINIKTDKVITTSVNVTGRTPLEELYAYLNHFRAETKKKTGLNLPATHRSMHNPTGNFNIPDDSVGKFNKLYTDAVLAGYSPHIVEVHKEYGPIVIDFDFVQTNDDSKRLYTNKHIIKIIKIYNELIEKYISCDKLDICAYVTEKNVPTLRKSEYHDGFHIMYPFICTKPSLQLILRDKLIEKIKETKLLEDISFTNTLDNVVDKSVIYKNGWLMYGSRKNPYYDPYELTYIYHCANNKIFNVLFPGDQKDPMTIKQIIKDTSIRKFDESDLNLHSSKVDPLELDAQVNKIALKMKSETNNDQIVAEIIGDNIHFVKATTDDVLIEVKNLLKMLSKKRAHDYDTWYQTGRCLHNIDHRLLVEWVNFSKMSSKYKSGECEQLWQKMKPSNYTMGTINYFAQKDNPQKYSEYKKEKIKNLVMEGVEASHYTIAKIVMEKFSFRFKCASVKDNLWYEYKNHRWNEIQRAYILRNIISEDIVNDYKIMRAVMYDDAKAGGKNGDRSAEDAKNISKVIAKLHDTNFKNGVISACADISYDPNFLKNLDENIHLLGFENGVYDLENNVFRDGCPDDYISLCTNYRYIPYNENDETSIELDDFLEKIQTDKEMREYIVTLLSTCLSGSITEESFYVLTGSGANGKSKLMELLKYTLGDYFKPMDIRLLTEKRSSSSSASPEVADKKGIRACPFDEPKSNDEINTGFMKIFTGGDTITARALFKEPIYFKPQFKPFLLCNHLPNINSDDDGTWRRLRVIPFDSKFVKPSDLTKEMRAGVWPAKHFPADHSLSERLPEWKQSFMGKLIIFYQKYKKNGLMHPPLVLQKTNEYRKRCDVFQDFMSDYLDKTGSPHHIMSIANLHENMKVWHKSNYDGKCPNAKDLRSYVKTRTDSYNDNKDCIIGYTVKSLDINDDNLDSEDN